MVVDDGAEAAHPRHVKIALMYGLFTKLEMGHAVFLLSFWRSGLCCWRFGGVRCQCFPGID